jgi:hypothetical protein
LNDYLRRLLAREVKVDVRRSGHAGIYMYTYTIFNLFRFIVLSYLRRLLSGQVKMDVRGAGHWRVRAAGRGGRGRGGGGTLAVIHKEGGEGGLDDCGKVERLEWRLKRRWEDQSDGFVNLCGWYGVLVCDYVLSL